MTVGTGPGSTCLPFQLLRRLRQQDLYIKACLGYIVQGQPGQLRESLYQNKNKAQWVKALVTKPDNMSSIIGTYKVEEENQCSKVTL